MLRAGILYTPGCEWSRAQIIVCWLLLARVIVHSFYFYIFIFSSIYVCTLCTNFIVNKLG